MQVLCKANTIKKQKIFILLSRSQNSMKNQVLESIILAEKQKKPLECLYSKGRYLYRSGTLLCINDDVDYLLNVRAIDCAVFVHVALLGC